MELPMLKYVNNLYKDIDLSEFSLISCQHYLETNQKMIFALMEKGLRAENIFMISKSYSYNKKIEERFREKGIFSYHYKYASHKSFDKLFKSYIKIFLKKIRPKLKTKILVIDDGAELIKGLNSLKNKEVHAVEQTSSGFNRLRKNRIKFPIINVARSKAKLEIESPFIADLTHKNILKELKKIKHKPKGVLILGAGPIGEEVKKLFNKKFPVKMFDKRIGFGKIKNLIRKDGLLIIGCTGETSIKRRHYKYLQKDVVLVSTSSSDREFDAVYLRRKLEENYDPHKNLHYKNICLLNSGFPITFDGSIHGTPPKKIQLTQSLMLAGAYESVAKKEKALITLNPEVQEKIIRKFNSLSY